MTPKQRSKLLADGTDIPLGLMVVMGAAGTGNTTFICYV